ncbi:hypothetical protein HZB00_01355 [Candidatus Woesearchaeota archaeon]|nr:hypothetical protein [Candidatus Woesearchaeota archaeon]
MIKQISLIFAIFMISFAFVSAHADSSVELVDPGITPDSALYFLDLAMENVGLALAFDNNAKVEKELDIAEERLSEAREMALKNNLEAMTKAEAKHREILTKVKAELRGLNSNSSKEELKKELQVEDRVNAHEKKVKIVKDELKIEIKIKGELTLEQQQLLNSLIASFENQTEQVGIEIDKEKKETKAKIKDETGQDGNEIENELQKELKIEDSNKIEVKVKDGIANVKVEINDTKQEFEIKIDSNQTQEQIRGQVMNEIVKKLSISNQEAGKITEEFEFENGEHGNKEVSEDKEKKKSENSESKDDEKRE